MFIKNWLKSPMFYGIGYLILYVVIGLILYKLDYMYLQGFRVFSILLIATLLIAGLVFYIKNKEGSALDQVFMLIILVIVTVIFLIVEALLPRERIVTVGNEKQVEVTSNTFLKENVNYYQYVNIFVRGNKIKVNEVEKQYNNTETIIDDDTTDILYEQRFSDTNIIRLRLIDYISSKNIVVVEKSIDNGECFINILENEEKNLTINRDAEVTFTNEEIGFIFDLGLLGKDDRYKKFLVTTDGGKTFNDVSITINGYGDLDYYYINSLPYLKNDKFVLDVSVPDGNNLKDIELVSNDDGLTFSN